MQTGRTGHPHDEGDRKSKGKKLLYNDMEWVLNGLEESVIRVFMGTGSSGYALIE